MDRGQPLSYSDAAWRVITGRPKRSQLSNSRQSKLRPSPLQVTEARQLHRYVTHTVALLLTCGVLACGGSSNGVTTEPDPVQPPPPALHPCTGALACESRVSVGAEAFLPIYATHSLDEGSAAYATSPTQAVIVIHGNSRNADDYFDRVVTAAQQAQQLANTVIVAPHFQTSADNPTPDEPFWTSAGWKRGHPSEGGRSPALSSYAALDSLLLRLTNRSLFPDLDRVVVSGHSAGGQVVHRYAAGSPTEEQLTSTTVRYVVANPSTYLYPTPLRESGSEYVVPAEDRCPDYNDWHYGFANLNSYMLAAGEGQARERLLGREVIIFLGEEDTGMANLDTSCGAYLQGANRLQRGLTLVRAIEHIFPENRHRTVTVPGVGHSSQGMFQSAQGRELLFAR